jgi:tetratricopeptide (TPR) repeat protein
MGGQAMGMNLRTLLAVCAAGALLISCGPKAQQPLSQLDTPQHHTFAGVKLLNQEKYDDAAREFELALKLDPRFANAHTGIALVRAYQANYTAAFESLAEANRLSASNGEKVFALVGYIRVNTLSHAACLKIGTECKPDEAWFRYARDAFEQAVRLDPKSAAAHYFMGECALTALDLDAAGRLFSKVLDLSTEHVGEAEARWKLVQKIQRALPGSINGRKIALVERLTRADAAALFMEEVKIDVLYERRNPKTFNAAFQDPSAARTAAARTTTTRDIASHPLRADIEALIRIGMRGLEVYPDGMFRPDEPVDRASFAMMIEDILVRVSGDEKLPTRFIGSTSPFPDLRADLPYFNAVMVVTSRGIMEARDMVTGQFAPLQPVAGADALLVIRKLKEELRF